MALELRYVDDDGDWVAYDVTDRAGVLVGTVVAYEGDQPETRAMAVYAATFEAAVRPSAGYQRLMGPMLDLDWFASQPPPDDDPGFVVR